MSIPPAIEKDIDAIKQPSNRILLRCLIGAVIAMSGTIVWLAKNTNTSATKQIEACHLLNDKKDTEIARLNNYIIQEAQADIQRERSNEERLNAIIDKYKSLLK